MEVEGTRSASLPDATRSSPAPHRTRRPSAARAARSPARGPAPRSPQRQCSGGASGARARPDLLPDRRPEDDGDAGGRTRTRQRQRSRTAAGRRPREQPHEHETSRTISLPRTSRADRLFPNGRGNPKPQPLRRVRPMSRLMRDISPRTYVVDVDTAPLSACRGVLRAKRARATGYWATGLLAILQQARSSRRPPSWPGARLVADCLNRK